MNQRFTTRCLLAALLCAAALATLPVLADETADGSTQATTEQADGSAVSGMTVAIDAETGETILPEPKLATQLHRETLRLMGEHFAAQTKAGKWSIPAKSHAMETKRGGLTGLVTGLDQLHLATVVVNADGSLATACDEPMAVESDATTDGEEQ